jgi:hypothetical protein
VDLLLTASFLMNGFHRINFGPWRRKCHGKGREGPSPGTGAIERA